MTAPTLALRGALRDVLVAVAAGDDAALDALEQAVTACRAADAPVPADDRPVLGAAEALLAGGDPPIDDRLRRRLGIPPPIEDAAAELRAARDGLKAHVDTHGDRPADRREPTGPYAALATAASVVLDYVEEVEFADHSQIGALAPIREEAQQAADLAAGGPALCALTGRPRRPLTEAGLAERLRDDHAGDLMFVKGLDWLAWDGARFRPDDDGERDRRTLSVIRSVQVESIHIVDKALKDATFNYAVKSESAARIDNVLKVGRKLVGLYGSPDDLDRHPDLFNVLNGTIDLRTGELRPHQRDDRLTKLARVQFDRSADCPRFRRAVDEWVGGDRQLADYLQTAIGYSLTGHIVEQCLFLIEGSGANGKSTFIETIHALAGGYAVRADATSFTTGHKRGVRSDLARLPGARFVPAVEIEADAQLAEVLVKQVTGGDTITASHLYKPEFEFKPQFKLWLAANSLPEIHGTDHAIWRRIRTIPFHHTVTRPDRNLGRTLTAELPGILNWAIEGAVRWHADGLPVPRAVTVATAEYRESSDSVAVFLAQATTPAPDGPGVPSGDMYAAFQAYCADTGLEPMSTTRFATRLKANGIEQRRTSTQRLWAGLELNR